MTSEQVAALIREAEQVVRATTSGPYWQLGSQMLAAIRAQQAELSLLGPVQWQGRDYDGWHDMESKEEAVRYTRAVLGRAYEDDIRAVRYLLEDNPSARHGRCQADARQHGPQGRGIIAMTSTDLAHALAVPLDTPGCWECSRCGGVVHSVRCRDCNAPADLFCLWPLPDSGLPGAELWTYWLMRALGWPSLQEHSQHPGQWHCGGYYGPWQPSPQAALYAAWQEQEKANG